MFIKSNPKLFVSYAKRFAKAKSIIAPLRNGEGSLVTESVKKAEILQSQYVGVFSNPEHADKQKSLLWLKKT